MAEPTEDILWAESAAGGDVSDPAAKRPAGYLFEDPWPHEEANYMFRALGRYVDWLKRGGGYESIAAGIAATAVGEAFTVDSRTSFGQPFGEDAATVSTTVETLAMTAMHSDGEFLWAAWGNSDIDQSALGADGAPSAMSATSGVFTPTNSGSIDKIVSNSQYVAFIQADRWLEVFDKATFTSQFVYDHTEGAGSEAIRDVAITEDRVAICGEARSSDSATVVVFNVATGTETGTVAWASECYGITNCWDEFVFKGGNGGTGADKQLARISTAGAVQWEINPATSMGAAEYQNIACNGRLVITHNGPGTAEINAYSVEDGGLVWTADSDAVPTNVDMLTVDCKNVYAGTGTETVVVLCATTGAMLHEIDASTDAVDVIVSSDHRFLYVSQYTAAGTIGAVERYRTDIAYRKWLRTDENFRSAFPGKAAPEVY